MAFIIRQPKAKFVEQRGPQGRREGAREGLRLPVLGSAETVRRRPVSLSGIAEAAFIGSRPAEPVLRAYAVIDLNGDRLPRAIHAGSIYGVLAFQCSSPPVSRGIQAIARTIIVWIGHYVRESFNESALIVFGSIRIPT